MSQCNTHGAYGQRYNSQILIALSGICLLSLHHRPAIVHSKSDMTTISAPAVGPSYFSQGEGSPSPLHSSVGQLVNWVSSELHVRFTLLTCRLGGLVLTDVHIIVLLRRKQRLCTNSGSFTGL